MGRRGLAIAAGLLAASGLVVAVFYYVGQPRTLRLAVGPLGSEDARMAAEEAFVYACATRPASCDISFSVGEGSLHMSFSLGEVVPDEDEELAEQIGLTELLLQAVSDSCGVSDDGAELCVLKRAGDAHAS
jgi:hypothetical protein